VWHDFIPVLARGLWLAGAGQLPDARGLAELCPQLTADGARAEHFRHVFAELDRGWRPGKAAAPGAESSADEKSTAGPSAEATSADDSLFAALAPALREFSSLLMFLQPAATQWTLAFADGRWSVTAPSDAPAPGLVRLLLQALPALPSRRGCPARVAWNVLLRAPGPPTEATAK
jgi:hypothetical protein